MMGRSRTLDDPYCPCEEEEELYDKKKYLAAIGTLLYLSTYMRSDFFLPPVCLLGTARDLERVIGIESNTCSNISKAQKTWACTTPRMELQRSLDTLMSALSHTRIMGNPGLATSFSRTMHQSHGSPWSRPSRPPLQTTQSWLLFTKLPGRQYGYVTCTKLSWSSVDSPKITLSLNNVACVAQVGAGLIKTDWVKHICP